MPGVRDWFNEALRTKLFPALAALFPELVTDPYAESSARWLDRQTERKRKHARAR